jgi:hypothetical protein
MNMRIGWKPQVTATPGLHSLYDWCFQTMWLFSGAPEDPEDETLMEKHSAEALCSAVNSLMHAIPVLRPGRSTGCGALDDPNCKALDNEEVVRIETREWETTCSDPDEECAPG